MARRPFAEGSRSAWPDQWTRAPSETIRSLETPVQLFGFAGAWTAVFGA